MRANRQKEACEKGLEDSGQTGPATLMANLSRTVPANTTEPSPELISMASVPNLNHWGFHGLQCSLSMHFQKQTA